MAGSFWKFGFAPAVNNIDQLLNQLPAPPSASSSGVSADSVTLSSADLALHQSTLDSLLATPDLLSEIKAGSNQRLVDFLARAEVVQRLGGWILWGLGGEQEDDVPNGGIISDDVMDGKVPDAIAAPAKKKKQVGMGNVPRRRDMDENGVLEGGTAETEQEKAWAGFPRLATEILTCDTPGLADILFQPTAASSQPYTCPSPRSFLVPFWEALLRSTELQIETRSILVGYWARVNTVLLTGSRGDEVISHIITIPHLLPRLLTLLPNCSPLNDLILLLLRTSPTSPFHNAVVPSALRMLDPLNSLGKPGHVAAEELLRGVIELSSAAPTPPLDPPGAPSQVSEGPDWRENFLAQQLADERTVRTMVDWMLAGLEDAPTSEDSTSTSTSTRSVSARPESPDLPPIPSLPDLTELRTSSLVQSISVLVDLIRKNNSDFVEQQMLSWAQKKEVEIGEREALGSDGDESFQSSLQADNDKGPSVVDLSALLATVANRLGGFQKLVKRPRTPHGPMATSAGSIRPLTLERFRICEFYAELLHCSNMSLLNRPERSPPLYNNQGFLSDGWKGGEELEQAISKASALGGGEEVELVPSAEGHSSPRSVEQSSYSGVSTPSVQGSLDSESGILTRAEAKELKDLVAAASSSEDESGDDDGKDPFGDPEDEETSSSERDLADATAALNLDEDLHTPRLEDAPGAATTEDVAQHATPPPQPTIARKRVTKPLPTGQLLKRKFLEFRIVDTMLDLFFNFPWNNFLHNVVFDIIQQIFHGRLDRTLDRELALSVFLDARLIDRILAGQAANDSNARTRTLRMGYMGHMTLIADEVVKLFEHFPEEIYAVVEPHIPQPDWDRYVATTLRETRERDLSPLGGGIQMGTHSASIVSGLSDEDDEFPLAAPRRPADTSALSGGASESSNSPVRRRTDSLEDASTGDKFSLYLANAISGDQQDSSDDDEEPDSGWLGSSRFDPTTSSFASNRTDNKFAFDDQFGSPGPAALARRDSSSSDDDDAWGRADAFGEGATTVASGFETSFSDSPFDSFTPTPNGDDGDDFGDFESAESPSIVLPSMDALDDFDFDESTRPTVQPNQTTATPPSPRSKPLPPIRTSPSPSRPTFARTATAEDGSALFGGLSSPNEDSRSISSENLIRRYASNSSLSPPTSPSVQADLATSLAEPLGPSMHGGSRLTSDGYVETIVDGKTVRVPADEIALAHRRLSLDSSERPNLSL